MDTSHLILNEKLLNDIQALVEQKIARYTLHELARAYLKLNRAHIETMTLEQLELAHTMLLYAQGKSQPPAKPSVYPPTEDEEGEFDYGNPV